MAYVVFIFWLMIQECLWSWSTLLPKELWNSLPQLYPEAISGKAQQAPTGRSVCGGPEAAWIAWVGRAQRAIELRKKIEVLGQRLLLPQRFAASGLALIHVPLIWSSSCLLWSHFRLVFSTCSLESMSVKSPSILFACLSPALGIRDTKTSKGCPWTKAFCLVEKTGM